MLKVAMISTVFNGTPVRFNNCNEDLNTVLGYFNSVPSMEVSEILLSGVIEGGQVTIEWPREEDPLGITDLISSRLSSAFEEVSIYYKIGGVIKKKFRGRVSTTERNPSGKPGFIKLFCRGLKDDLETPLGQQCLDTCTQTFGLCGVNLSLWRDICTVTSITNGGRTIRVSSFSQDAERYTNGEVRINGVSFSIRRVDPNNDIQLVRLMNPAWIGGSATITTGCKHDHESCKFYGNEINNLTLGFNMPNVNPLFESGE